MASSLSIIIYLFIYLPSLLSSGKTFVIPLRKATDIPTVSEMEGKNVLESTAKSQNMNVTQGFDEQGKFLLQLTVVISVFHS